MTKRRRSFFAGLNRKAADFVLDQVCSHIEADRSLRIVESALRRFVKHCASIAEDDFSHSGGQKESIL